MLVVGVGTGLELELLPAELRVTGVDISARCWSARAPRRP